MIKIETSNNQLEFRPGEMVSVAVTWDLESGDAGLELALLWYTQGKGTEDIKSVWSEQIASSGRRGTRSFRVPLPAAPYSCSGKYVSICWAIEAVDSSGNEVTRQEIVIAPNGKPVSLVNTSDSI